MRSIKTRGVIAAAAMALATTMVAAPSFAQGMMNSEKSMSGSMGMEKTKTVGGSKMYPSKTIVDNAVNSKDHTTLVAAVKAAGLVDTLSGPGPFTVFAPTNKAFGKLPKGTVESLVQPENKKALTGILTYHVVAGRLNAKELMKEVKDGGGSATLKTVEGESLTVTQPSKSKLLVTDARGETARITIADVYQSNGVIHVVDGVLLPKA